MTKQEAKDTLNHYRGDLISQIYYEYDEVSEAILSLRPNFQYSEWSNKIVHEFLEDYNAQHCEWDY